VREDIRTVDVVARSAGQARLDPARVGDFTLSGANGERVSLSQVGKLEVQMEEPVLLRRDRVPTVTVRGNIADPSDAVVEATVQRSRPVILTALAAVLAFVPLTHSVFWGAMAFTLIGGTLGGTIMTLVFRPALYTLWHRIGGGEQPVPVVPAVQRRGNCDDRSLPRQ
jgi:multidrug efflux pump subunit AcrB